MAHDRLVIDAARWQSRIAPSDVVRVRRRPLKQRLVIAAIVFAIVLLALGGWIAQALRS